MADATVQAILSAEAAKEAGIQEAANADADPPALEQRRARVLRYVAPITTGRRHPHLVGKEGVYPMAADKLEAAPIPEFPKEWFNQNNSKPKCPLRTFTVTDEDLQRTVHGGLSLGGLDPLVVALYLYRTASKLKATAEVGWESFGQLIVAEGQEYTPLNLLKVEPTAYTGTMPKLYVTACPVSDLTLLVGIMLQYRVMNANLRAAETDYAVTLSKRLRESVGDRM